MSKKIEKASVAKTWHGKPMYQCPKCPWNTLNSDEMDKHAARHAAESFKKVRQVDTGLIGPSGGKIVREQVVEPEAPAEEESNG